MPVWASLPRQLFGGRKANAEREGLHVPDPGVLRLSAAGLTVLQVAAGTRLSVGAVSRHPKAGRAASLGVT
jgi:hypothetical protein